MDMATGIAGSIVELAGVYKAYGNHTVLHDLNLSLPRGEYLALLGHNGAGKTTLLKLMLGLSTPTRGRIRYHGPDDGEAAGDRWRRDLGFLPESVAFHDNLSGREMLRFYARLKGCSADECNAVLERVGLADAAANRIRTYSKGMRQRLGLAQALMGNPSVLLLDEPTSGLDPALRREFYGFISEHQAAGGTTLISSHTLSEIEQSARRFVILKHGRLVADGTLEQLRHAARLPAHIRMTVEPGELGRVMERLGSRCESRRISDCVVDLACADSEKIGLLRAVTGLEAPIVDIEVMPAKLEQVYAYFTNGEEGER